MAPERPSVIPDGRWYNMLERLADWFYDPVVFWGIPFVLLGAWAAMKWVRGRLRRREPRR